MGRQRGLTVRHGPSENPLVQTRSLHTSKRLLDLNRRHCVYSRGRFSFCPVPTLPLAVSLGPILINFVLSLATCLNRRARHVCLCCMSKQDGHLRMCVRGCMSADVYPSGT